MQPREAPPFGLSRYSGHKLSGHPRGRTLSLGVAQETPARARLFT